MDAIRKINPDLVERTIRRGHEALIRAGTPKPKIGVCAINPHAGKNGLFGQGEEAGVVTETTRPRGLLGHHFVPPMP